ncbi:MAG: acyltransferase [Deltaproteobacteria bacterium]|nr:acyltransferase [Deltaproteobacteria bacterium]
MNTPTEQPHRPSGYRPDVDGLRAVAVLAVLFYHAGSFGVSGGFVGVDVFFVISGFVIARQSYGLLAKDEARAPGSKEPHFSAIGFYSRRICRIFPASFVVLGVVSLAGVLVLLPRDLTGLARALAPASLFYSNVYFWRDQGYFEPAAEDRFLLHMWSLAVEEQFYVLWPAVLLGLRRRVLQRSFARILLVTLLVSFSLAFAGVLRAPSATFYLSPTRAWEFLIGAILAHPTMPAASPVTARLAGVAGLTLILTSLLAFDRETLFPGPLAAVPCLGAGLVIWSGQDSPSGRFLSTRGMVFIGLLSYSLYLWHWPFIVFFRYAAMRGPRLHEGLGLVLVSILAAYSSWKWIEQPTRRRYATVQRRRELWVGGFGLIASAVALSFVLKIDGGLRSRFSPSVLTPHDVGSSRNKHASTCLARGDFVPRSDKCLVGAPGSRSAPAVIVWGDSHASQYVPGLGKLAAEEGSTVRQATKGACHPLIGYYAHALGSKPWKECESFGADAFRLIEETSSVRTVVLIARWASAARDEAGLSALETSLRNSVSALVAAKKSVLIFTQPPEFEFSPPDCVARARSFGREPETCLSIQRSSPSVQSIERSNVVVKKVAAEFEGVRLFDPFSKLCGPDHCSADQDGMIMYQDFGHLSVEGAAAMLSALGLTSSIAVTRSSLGSAQTSTTGSPKLR